MFYHITPVLCDSKYMGLKCTNHNITSVKINTNRINMFSCGFVRVEPLLFAVSSLFSCPAWRECNAGDVGMTVVGGSCVQCSLIFIDGATSSSVNSDAAGVH